MPPDGHATHNETRATEARPNTQDCGHVSFMAANMAALCRIVQPVVRCNINPTVNVGFTVEVNRAARRVAEACAARRARVLAEQILMLAMTPHIGRREATQRRDH
jgi:hypothetical protein